MFGPGLEESYFMKQFYRHVIHKVLKMLTTSIALDGAEDYSGVAVNRVPHSFVEAYQKVATILVV